MSSMLFQEHATGQKKIGRADPDTKESHSPGRACLIHPYKNLKKRVNRAKNYFLSTAFTLFNVNLSRRNML
jgi:hypothetical protein